MRSPCGAAAQLPLRFKSVTIGDLIREGKLLEVHCGNCQPERHLYVDPESLGLPRRDNASGFTIEESSTKRRGSRVGSHTLTGMRFPMVGAQSRHTAPVRNVYHALSALAWRRSESRTSLALIEGTGFAYEPFGSAIPSCPRATC
jgi:hypothetical protein